MRKIAHVLLFAETHSAFMHVMLNALDMKAKEIEVKVILAEGSFSLHQH